MTKQRIVHGQRAERLTQRHDDVILVEVNRVKVKTKANAKGKNKGKDGAGKKGLSADVCKLRGRGPRPSALRESSSHSTPGCSFSQRGGPPVRSRSGGKSELRGPGW